MPDRVVLSYGMGLDSTAILLRWLEDEGSRDFDLDRLVVVTAMTGDEFPETGVHVARHVVPRLAEHGVRWVQIARGGPVKADGVTVLADTRSPNAVYLGGDYKLSDELRASGTVPQSGGTRKCSIKAKGEPIDRWLEPELAGATFRHVIGFAAGEERRAVRDSREGADFPGRHPEYPLIDWGWDRAVAGDYIASVTGVAEWPKSCCSYCPFSRDHHAQRYVDSPHLAVDAMLMELRAVALNPRSGRLFATKSLILEHEDTPTHQAFLQRIGSIDWALYDVRRVMYRAGVGARSVEPLYVGSPVRAHRDLHALAADLGATVVVDEFGLARATVIDRGDTYPAIERMLVVGPADGGPVHKIGRGFTDAWNRLATEADRSAA